MNDSGVRDRAVLKRRTPRRSFAREPIGVTERNLYRIRKHGEALVVGAGWILHQRSSAYRETRDDVDGTSSWSNGGALGGRRCVGGCSWCCRYWSRLNLCQQSGGIEMHLVRLCLAGTIPGKMVRTCRFVVFGSCVLQSSDSLPWSPWFVRRRMIDTIGVVGVVPGLPLSMESYLGNRRFRDRATHKYKAKPSQPAALAHL
jgi:hypothetical protein